MRLSIPLSEVAAILLAAMTTPAVAGKPGGGGTPPPPSPLPVTYKVQWLTGFGGQVEPYCMSDSGFVAGKANYPNGTPSAFVVPPGGAMQDLNVLAANYTWFDGDAPSEASDTVKAKWWMTSAHGINETGMIAGMFVAAGQTANASAPIRSFRFDPVTQRVVLLPANGATQARTGFYNHVNEFGDVAYTDQTHGRVLLFTGPGPGGDQLFYPVSSAFVSGIADDGRMTGGFYASAGGITGNFNGNSYRYTPGGALETAPFLGCELYNISPDGNWVAGHQKAAAKGTGTKYRAVRYRDAAGGLLQLAGDDSHAYAVNSAGDTAGTYLGGSGPGATFLYMDGYGLIDLTQRFAVPYFAPVSVTARDGNGFASLCGTAADAAGVLQAVVAYPAKSP